MTRFAMLLVSTSILAAPGCSVLHVPEPLGDAPVMLSPDEWNATWCDATAVTPVPGTTMVSFDDADCGVITVVDPPGGVLDLVGTDGSDPGRVHLRYIGNDRQSMYATLEDEGGLLFGALVVRKGNVIITWDVSASAVADEIKAGRLEGQTAGDDVWPVPGPELLRRIAADRHLFESTPDFVMIRVSQ